MSGPNAVGRLAWQLRSFLVLVLVVTSATAVSAQQSSIVRVEEDWELVVSDPNSYSDAPQVTCAISPTGDVRSVYANFELNHRTLPDFLPGGLQLQVWNGSSPIASHSYPSETSLSQDGETITWRATMEISGGLVTFEITNGHSLAWGAFGGEGNLKAVISTSLPDLSGYRPETSVANSGVGYAGNRVQSLTLKAVRVFFSNGEQVVDNNPRTVYVKN